MSGPDGSIVYAFGRFRLNPRLRLLFAEGASAPVPLPPRVLDTLLYFVQRPGRLLSKQELLKAVWPRVVVEENSLNQHVSMLRRVLGETPGEHRFIATVPGRGYQFVADVHTIRGDEPQAWGAEPSSLTAGAAHAGKPAAIAVLPLANLTGDPGKEYLGEAIAEELIHSLARIPGLKVPARTSTFAYKGRNVNVRDIARELGVSAVLEGSVRAAGERVRITVQLVDGESGYHVWSHSLERPFADLFALQDELAAQVTRAMNLEGVPAGALQRPRDLEAYHLYLQALALSLRPSAENTRGAIELLRQALTRDARFARASSLLALQYTMCVIFDFPFPGALQAAEREAERALLLDPGDGTTHGAVGVIEAIRGNWLGSATHFRTSRALGSDAFTSSAECGYLTHSVGHIRQALQDAEQTFRSAPTQPMSARLLALTCLCVGRDADARRYADLCIQLGQSRGVAPLPEVYGMLALRAGRFAEAAEHLIGGLSDELRAAAGAAVIEQFCAALADPANRSAALSALDAFERRATPEALDQPMRKRMTLWRTMLGDLDGAFDFSARSLALYERGGTVGSAWGFLWLPEMKPFRRDLRFHDFVTRLKLPDYWREYGAPDDCELHDGRLVVR